MSLWKKLFSSDIQTNKNKVYKSTDNLGTYYSDVKKVNAAWQVQGMMLGKGNVITTYNSKGESTERISKGYPYICYKFKTEDAARKGLSSISFIKIANDTNEFISLEILEFGCYETEKKGLWEVTIWGENFTKEMFKESETKLAAAGGDKKGERIPTTHTTAKSKESQKAGKTTYVKTEVQGPNTYEIHKAPSKEAALEFLKSKTVTKGLYYVIVETPGGN